MEEAHLMFESAPNSVDSLPKCLAWAFLHASNLVYFDEASSECRKAQFNSSSQGWRGSIFVQHGTTFPQFFKESPELMLTNETSQLTADFVFEGITAMAACALKCITMETCSFYVYKSQKCFMGAFNFTTGQAVFKK